MGPAIRRFLNAVERLAKNKDITIDEVYDFAKREFGEVSDLLKIQVNRIFKNVEAPSIKKPGKPEGEVVPIKPKGEPSQESGTIMDRIGAASNRIDEILKEREAMYKPKPEESPVMKRLEEGIETLKGMKQPGMDLTVGLTRTAVRKILAKEGIDVPDKADPIDIFTKRFGADILMDVRNVAEEMIELERMGKSTKSMDEILEQEGMFNLPKRKNPPQGYSDEEMAEITKAIAQEDELLKFDPKGRKPNSEGGINRVGLKSGSYLYKAYKGSALERLMNDPKVVGTELGYEGISSLMDILRGFGLFSNGGRAGFAGGGGKTKMGIAALEAALKKIMEKFGKGSIGTVEDMAKKGELKLDPNIKKYQDDKKAVFDFNMRQLNKTEADANKEMDKIIQDQIQGGFLRDMKRSMDKDMVRELDKPERTILDVPPVPKGFKLSKEKLMQKFPEIDEGFADDMMKMDRDTQGRIIKMLENRRLDPEAYDRLLEQYGDTLEFQKEFDKVVRRKKNSEGGLSYLMGM